MYCRQCGGPTTLDEGAHPWCTACNEFDWINPAPAVGVAVVRGNEVLLAKRARDPKIGQWDLIGGFVEPGETIPEAVRREAQEETGIQLTGLHRLHQAPGSYGPNQPTLNFMYVAHTDDTPTPSDDVAEVAWFPVDELPALAWPHEAEALARLATKL